MYINHAAGELYFATLTVFADNFWYGNKMITFLFSTIKLCTMAITTRDVLAHMSWAPFFPPCSGGWLLVSQGSDRVAEVVKWV